MDVRGKHISVIGAARSGLAVARLLTRHGAHVLVSDHKPDQGGLQKTLMEEGIESEFGGHTQRVDHADFLVLSPGVPDSAPPVAEAIRTGTPVHSEIEVASWFCKGPVIGITGSNGKTTTTALTGHIFKTANRKHVVGGNIGRPFSDFADTMDADETAILELSSFQLDHIDSFKPSVSVLLNITPDHLDRYGYRFEDYARSKCRVFENQSAGNWIIYNEDDIVVRDAVAAKSSSTGARALGISLLSEPPGGAFIRDGRIIFRIHNQEEPLMNVRQVALRGQHNLYNSLAAAVSARITDIRSDVIRESLMSFEGVPHRLEFVREMNGVRYYNDSKATNVNAVWYALESFHEPIVLIAGGRDKGNDYSSLKALVRDKVRLLIGLGEESGRKVLADLGDQAAESQFAADMEEAVEIAGREARRGEVVLLSPACASFDQFMNYEDRGNVFRALVERL